MAGRGFCRVGLLGSRMATIRCSASTILPLTTFSRIPTCEALPSFCITTRAPTSCSHGVRRHDLEIRRCGPRGLPQAFAGLDARDVFDDFHIAARGTLPGS